ncbi:YceI family protein [Riemerella columbipharyngis]|uniref:Polyisoprenoid-binding protein YceI n=1 Tax=Riemerella columbipharyngis TaxID=1071918 RepID=A0A1G7A805_9FLAO|nr:YceI family protein [Riemerella columbipharyngis]SDE10959.1 Polyisoprenoid-binding protein YceI [Riemerella columbipharyngis]
MKKRLFSLAVVSSLGLICLVSCSKDKKLVSESNTVSTTKDGTVYEVDTVESKIEWKGYKVMKSDNTSHYGDVKLQSGELTIKDGMLESGTFVADVKSLHNQDIIDDAEHSQKLDDHLKSDDFFGVEKHPTATYEITKVEKGSGDYNTVLEGNLTIKGVTKPLKVNANVTTSDDEVSLNTEPTDINREDFGVSFKSPMKDMVIKNEITLQVSIKAHKK